MRVIKDMTPHKEISCPWCSSILEIEKSDIKDVFLESLKDATATYRGHIICPCCKDVFGYRYTEGHFCEGYTINY